MKGVCSVDFDVHILHDNTLEKPTLAKFSCPTSSVVSQPFLMRS
jgi:hypothetical protein